LLSFVNIDLSGQHECFEIMFPSHQHQPIELKDELTDSPLNTSAVFEGGDFIDSADDFADVEFDEQSSASNSDRPNKRQPTLTSSSLSIKSVRFP